MAILAVVSKEPQNTLRRFLLFGRFCDRGSTDSIGNY